MAAEFGSGTRNGRRAYILMLAAVALGVVGVSWWFSQIRQSDGLGHGTELWILTVLALVAGLLSFVTKNPSGAVVVINPAVCFTFAILLSGELVPAIAAQVAAVALLTWRRRLPAIRGLLMAVQFAVASAPAYVVLSLGNPIRGARREPADFRETAIDIIAVIVWLAAYTAFGYLVSRLLTPRLGAHMPPPTGYGLLFNGGLVVLSPVVVVVTQANILYAVLVLVPIYAVERMARLSAERERAMSLDTLTSLANRGMLRERFDRLAATYGQREARRSTNHLALLMLDLDRFKDVNKSLGHEVGDQLLKAVTVRLTTLDTGDGLVARLGGDKFAVLARVPDRQAANALGLRVEALREPVTLESLRIYVTVSIGVALWVGEASVDFAALLGKAETAMYDAKRRGDGIAFYDDHGESDDPEQLHLLADFREALQNRDNGEIAMQYQPQISLDTGGIDGLEALLRWTHPVYGTIAPSTILAIAEYTPVMNLLTARIIDDVTAQIANWRHHGITPRVALNVSARDLFGEGIVERLGQRLEQHQLAPTQLQIEVTESALMADPAQARNMIIRIADLGIDISLDDFGTGYSSMQHLRRIPLSEIKIDRTFVAAMSQNRDDAAIVASMIDMAHALGLRAVAEGVADEPTRQMLVDLGCDLGQGWHFSRAIPADLIPSLIRETATSVGRPIQ